MSPAPAAPATPEPTPLPRREQRQHPLHGGQDKPPVAAVARQGRRAGTQGQEGWGHHALSTESLTLAAAIPASVFPAVCAGPQWGGPAPSIYPEPRPPRLGGTAPMEVVVFCCASPEAGPLAVSNTTLVAAL